MTRRPSRAKMCNWLAGAIAGVQTRPSNPADFGRMAQLGVIAEKKLRDLRSITSDLGWHIDADLDTAWEEIQAYDKKWNADAPDH